MNMNEYEQVKSYSYEEYVEYLQKKYGLAPANYMTPTGTKNLYKNSRTSEGLVIHHKYEDRAFSLSHKSAVNIFPYEYQHAENLVYCDYLEHLFLHVLIFEKINELYNNKWLLNGAFQFIIPEINDVYSGWKTKESWRLKCHSVIINDKPVYMELIKRLIIKKADLSELTKSFNSRFGIWSSNNNEVIYNEIKKIHDYIWHDGESV